MTHPRVASDPDLAPTIGIERAVTVGKAALEMGADPATVRRLLKEDELRGYRLGKRGVRIYVSSIQAYQERQKLGQKTKSSARSTPIVKRVATPAHREAVATLAELGILRPSPHR
ncbi:helix-turn-helix domain-containing protein [Azospirillum griseum]|nr:helix-turn-helix domain-containing protein [Azospirillum griseum]